MDSRPIGIFDSGVGGLTVAKELYKLLPHESTVYIGDTARIPYGPRSKETVTHFSRQLVKFLLTKNVKLIVVACSTASAQALPTLHKEFSVPFIGVIEPTAKAAAQATKSNHIIVLGTKGTVKSQAFVNTLNEYKANLKIEQFACPLLVPLIEEGIFKGPILEAVLDEYLSHLKTSGADQIILGCTHYPVIKKAIERYLNNSTAQLINPGIATAHQVSKFLAEHGLIANPQSKASHQYFTTDNPSLFLSIASNFLGQPLHNHTQQIDIEQY